MVLLFFTRDVLKYHTRPSVPREWISYLPSLKSPLDQAITTFEKETGTTM